MTKLIRPVNNS